jgi:hypothetical protein
MLSYLICGHKYEKIKNLFIFLKVQKKFEPIQKDLKYRYFLPKRMPINSQKYRFGIQDQENLIRMSNPGSATLLLFARNVQYLS